MAELPIIFPGNILTIAMQGSKFETEKINIG